MSDHVSKFIDHMRSKGCGPSRASDVVPTPPGKWYDIDLEGDKPKSKKLYYRLTIDEMGAVGQFGNRREGDTYTWWPKYKDKNWTDEQRAAWKSRVDEQRARQEAEQERGYKEAASEAELAWAMAGEAQTHPYLTRKGVKAVGLRIEGDELLVPMRDRKGGLASLQRIGPDGDKMFMRGGRTDGVYMLIGQPGPIMCVAEGYATGWSVHEATGYPVAVAFCARNLPSVAKILRANDAQARIIITADNDEKEGKKNTGVEKGQQAAVAVGGYCVWPAMPGDFNDLAQAEGMPAVTAIIATATKKNEDEGRPVTLEDLESIPHAEEDERSRAELVSLYSLPKKAADPNWRKFLLKTENGVLKHKSIINLDLMLRNHDEYVGLFIYDEFSNEKTVCRCPPWEDDKRFTPHVLRDEDITGLAIDLARKKLEPGYDNIRRVLDSMIKTLSRHPAREYFNSLVWDGEPRLSTWLTKYCKAGHDHPDYLAAVGTKWMAACVARVFEPGCKFDHIPIFEGAQSAGKSLMLKELATIHKRAYFTDTIKIRDIDRPDSVRKMQGRLIIELAELSGFKDKDVNELKQAVTITEDVIRQLYQNEPTAYPRQFVFAGTTNNTNYLHDVTGNRRFWPVKVGGKIDIAGIKRDKEQLWAEAVDRYRAGETLYLEDNLYALAEAAQAERQTIDVWHHDVEKLARGQSFVPSEDIWLLLVPVKAQRTAAMQDRITGIMTVLGYERSRVRHKGEPVRGWTKKGTDGVNQHQQEEIDL